LSRSDKLKKNWCRPYPLFFRQKSRGKTNCIRIRLHYARK